MSCCKLTKTVEADPEFDTKKAKKKLRRYVEGHEHAIQLKAELDGYQGLRAGTGC